MNSEEKKYQELRDAVERFLGLHLNTKRDFELLSVEIFKHRKVLLSATTLRRFWGYQEQDTHRTSTATLDVLSRLVGYANWETFVNNETDDDSQFMNPRNSLLTSSLSEGDRLVVSWNPGRIVTLEFIGGDVFRVIESQNSKLQEKDTFHCQQFVEGMPLFCKGLLRENHNLMNYIAAKNSGITFHLLSR